MQHEQTAGCSTPTEIDVVAMLPWLRNRARRFVPDREAADSLVAVVLELAIEKVAEKPEELNVQSWLAGVFERAVELRRASEPMDAL